MKARLAASARSRFPGLRTQWPPLVGPPPEPACPPGFRIGSPDFVGVGAHKAGTSWWFSLVAGHPRVYTVPGLSKELHFFDRFWGEEFTESTRESYRRFFPRPNGSITGEWTPRYMHDPWTPPLLKAAAPDAKLLILLRDPIERYLSGLAHDLARGAPRSAVVAATHLSRGCYVSQLRQVLTHFDGGRVLILQYERCAADPLTELRKTYAFLGLEPIDFVPPAIERHINRTSHGKPTLPSEARKHLVGAYEHEVLDLVCNFTEIDVAAWPNFAHLSAEVAGAHSRITQNTASFHRDPLAEAPA